MNINSTPLSTVIFFVFENHTQIQHVKTLRFRKRFVNGPVAYITNLVLWKKYVVSKKEDFYFRVKR